MGADVRLALQSRRLTGDIQICVDHAGRLVCRDVRLRPVPGHPGRRRASISWRAHFRATGAGSYLVRFTQADRDLGPPIRFVI